MKKILLSALVFSAFVISAFTPSGPAIGNGNHPSDQVTNWTIDKPHTNAKFSVSHLVISDVEGLFKTIDGSMTFSKADFSDAKIDFTVEVASLSTDNEMRDNHLKSDDFFNAAKFPQIKFTSTSFTPLGDNKYKLVGNLTIRDITKSVSFDVKYGGTITAMGGTHIGFKATTTLNRFDYNLKFDKTTPDGANIVGKDVEITVNVDFKKS
jgi:polyisoprenoid-binding protein YceI